MAAYSRYPEFPPEFKEINLVINSYAHEKKLLDKGLVPAEIVKETEQQFEAA